MQETLPATEPAAEFQTEVEAQALAQSQVENEAQALAQSQTDAQLQESLSKIKQIQIVDLTSGVGSNSIDYGDNYIAEQTSQRGFKGFVKRIWQGNIAHDYIRQRQIQRGRSEIIETQNLNVLVGGTAAEHSEAAAAITERFVEGAIHAGETVRDMDATEQGKQFQDQVKTLIRGYADSSVSLEELQEARTRLVSDYGKQLNKDDRNKGLLFADNIIEVAVASKAAFGHGVALETIDQMISITHGEARVGARTEARQTTTDKIVNSLYSTKAGSLVNETTLALAVGTVMTIGKFTTRKLATAAGAFIGLGVGAGLIAGARGHAKIGNERQLHGRQHATGQELPATGSAKRREKIEETRYETVRAVDLQDRLAEARAAVDDADPVSKEDLLLVVSEIDSRIRISDEESKDLIQFESEMSLERQRLDLDLQLRAAKIQLGGLGIAESVVKERVATVIESLRSDITEKDRLFKHLQRSETLKMAALGFVSGVVIGDGIQEIKAAFSDDLQGVFEGDSSGQERRTLLAGVFGAHHQAGANHLAVAGNQTVVNKDLSVGMPPNYHLQPTSAGHYELLGPDNKALVGNIALDNHGQIDQASIAELRQAGVTMNSHLVPYTTTQVTYDHASRTPAEYLQAHGDKFTTLHREMWYDNDTTIFDKNELRLDWGGQGGTGVDAHGNYQFDVKSMFPAGSFHEGAHTNAQELLKQGKLAIALSMDRATQAHALMMKVDANGIATIKADSWEARSLFEMRDGQAHYIGGYAEAVQLMGQNPKGGESVRMLASVVGDNHPRAGVDTLKHIITTEHQRTVMTMDVAEKADIPIEIPFPVPIYGRRGLESLVKAGEKADPINPDFVGLYYGGHSLKEIQKWISEDPSRLKHRELIVSPDGAKQWVEADGSPVERNVERERAAIADYLELQRDKSPKHFQKVEEIADSMAPMVDNCRVAVTVPAWLEAKNLKNFLEQYTQQVNTDGTPLDSSLYEVNVLINRKTGSEADNSTEVIENFIQEFEDRTGAKPKVNYYDVEVDPPNNNVGYARKLLADAVLLRSQRRENQTEPLYFESEDADLVQLDERTVTNLIKKLDAKPHLDAVRGLADRSPEYLKDNDLLFLRRRIWDFAEILARNKQFRDPTSPSWNYMWNRNWMNGWNAGYSAEAYVLSGGYDAVSVGEDMRLGEKMTMIRGDGTLPNLEVVGNVGSKSDGSPRRFIAEILRKKDAYTKDFSDEALNKELRERSIPDLMETISDYSRITPENKGTFEGLVTGYSSFIRTVTPNDAAARQTMKRLMHMLAFQPDDYKFMPDGKVKVTNWDHLSEALQRYRDRVAPQTPIEKFNRLRPVPVIA